jgi:UDP-glucose 4-epimerase
VLEAAREWQVPRVGLASTIGVYGGVTEPSPLREDVPLPMAAMHAIPVFKKIGELAADYLADLIGVEIYNARIAAIWGPLGRTASPFFGAPQLLHAAVRGTEPDMSAMRAPAQADDAIDLCYVKDCARAIALLQLADRLSYRTYNVASGRPTTNAEVVEAIQKVVPGVQFDLPSGRGPQNLYLDISRLNADTGYTPEYDTERSAADYFDWLRAGNDR